jgi:hypothetical protein
MKKQMVCVLLLVGAFRVVADGGIDDFYFRYDFSKGEKVYEDNGCETEPCSSGVGYTGVYGSAGYNGAVHPKGWGAIAGGNELMNADWSVAMSVKSCDVDKGVLLCLGSNGTLGNKQVLFCSSKTAGRLHVAICQNWNGGRNVNIPTYINLDDLGDTTNSFHSLVAVHTIADNVIKLYWDGVLVNGSWNSNANQGGKSFTGGFQFCSAHGGCPSGYSDQSENLEVAFQDVRYFTRALSADEAALYAQAFPPAPVKLDDQFFRYDFTSGERVFTGNDDVDPAGTASSDSPVNGPEGENKAVHPTGYGTISNGDTLLNENWTVTMCVKPGTAPKGILLCLGSNATVNRKQVLLCTGGGEGSLHTAVCQRWTSSTSSSNYKNIPASYNSNGLGETSARFHTIVAVHTKVEGKSTGTISLFFDGNSAGSFNSYASSDSRPFANGFQFCSAYGGLTDYLRNDMGFHAQDGNADVAFQDVRFYTNAWTAAEAKLYARLYPPREPFGIEELTWTNAAGDGSFENLENWSSNKLPKTDEKVTIEVAEDTQMNVAGAYSLTELNVAGSGMVTFAGEGSVSTKFINAGTGTGIIVDDRIVPTAMVDLAANSTVRITGARGPSALAFSGSGSLQLDPGAGNTYTMSGSNTKYTGEAVIVSGTVKFGDSTSFGVNGRSAFIRVKGGATLDENGKTDGGESEKNKVILEAGAVFTSNPGFSDSKLPPVTTLTLEGDATVDASAGLVSISRHFNNGYTYINLGEHTLTKTGANAFFISACDIEGTGVLDVREGTLMATHAYWKNAPGKCPNATIRVGDGATFRLANYNKAQVVFSVNNLILDGELTRDSGYDHMLTVTGSVTGKGTAQMLTMGEGAVFKPNGEDYFTVSEVLNGTMIVDTGDFDMSARKTPLPLFKVGSAEMLPAEGDIAFSAGAVPRGWKLFPAEEGYGYMLQRVGFAIFLR